MEDRCRICQRPATHSFGSYRFCDEHYERAQHQRDSLWRADLLSIGALIVFVVAVYALNAVLQPKLKGSDLLAVGVVLALVPAGIWLAFFYRRDRLEPEPKGMVLGVFVLGALVAAAVGIPLVDRFFDVGDWLGSSLLTQILGGVLVIGVIQMTLIYLTVRLSVYQSTEFDEWTDGILYGTAAGLGYATVSNIFFITDAGGADLGLGAIRVALTAIVLGSLGGLVGYFLGHDRMEVRPVWWVAAGVALAAILDGIYFWIRTQVTGGIVSGVSSNWIGLVLAVVLAGAVTWFLARAVARAMARALAAGSGAAPPGDAAPPPMAPASSGAGDAS